MVQMPLKLLARIYRNHWPKYSGTFSYNVGCPNSRQRSLEYKNVTIVFEREITNLLVNLYFFVDSSPNISIVRWTGILSSRIMRISTLSYLPRLIGGATHVCVQKRFHAFIAELLFNSEEHHPKTFYLLE